MRNEAREARDLLLRCCGIAPDNAEAWNAMGLALRMGGEAVLALAAFVRAQGLQPNCAEYVLNGVDVAEEAKETDAEIARLKVACDKDPLNIALQIGCGSLLARAGQRDGSNRRAGSRNQARTRRTSAVEAAWYRLDPCQPQQGSGGGSAANTRDRSGRSVVGNDLAVVLMRLQRNAEARIMLREVLERHGTQSRALCNLANATVQVGLQDEAVMLAHRAIRG